MLLPIQTQTNNNVINKQMCLQLHQYEKVDQCFASCYCHGNNSLINHLWFNLKVSFSTKERCCHDNINFDLECCLYIQNWNIVCPSITTTSTVCWYTVQGEVCYYQICKHVAISFSGLIINKIINYMNPFSIVYECLW